MSKAVIAPLALMVNFMLILSMLHLNTNAALMDNFVIILFILFSEYTGQTLTMEHY